ncbi:MAG: hypothetical protein C0602_01200 [Denitrovibrio sp.]|nr:MAG: hypothetical protein C0602_01200 [Denitrovibrio sp.]
MNRKGFSLVEMAVVLIIFGLVLASASSILTLFVNKGGAERTRKMMESNKSALFSIAGSEQYPYLMETATDSMTASDQNAELKDLSYPQDAYGRDFLLILDSALGYTDAKDQLDYSPICVSATTNNKVVICGDSTCDETDTATNTIVDNAAFVLISGSVNKNIQTNVASNFIKIYQQGTDAVDDYATDMDRAEKYDDIVDWVTLPELRSKAGCDPNRLDLLDSSMPVIQAGEPYNFDIYPTGGIPYVDGTVATEEEYLIELDEDDDILLTNVLIKVIDGDGVGETDLLADADSGTGTHLQFYGNASSTVAKSSYRVIIKVTDDAGNNITRTLYIKRQD